MKDGPSGRANPDKRIRRSSKVRSKWPTYLLKNVPEDERRWLSNQAQAWDVSVSDIVRSILCENFRLVCPPESYGYEPERDQQSPNLLLRLQPKLDRALENAAAKTGKSKRKLILDALARQYRD